MNPVAEALLAWSESDALGKDIEDVLHLENEETRQKVINPVLKVIKDKLIIGLANKTMFIDIDHFKLINDTLGHEIGDMLLKEIAKRLAGCVRKGDTLARLGGDEFIIILEDAHSDTAAEVAEAINETLSSKFFINGYELFTSASIGISFYPDHGENVDTLIKSADMAMYVAKTNGKNNYQYFAPIMNDKAQRIMEIDNGLREAFDRNEFELYYQSKLGLNTGAIMGVEALIRWRHPELAQISPAEFIPIAEENGMIGVIGEWVLQAACRQCKEWQKAGYPAIRVSVNVSTLQFRQQELVTTIQRVLDETELDPSYLELEITESVMQDEETIKIIMELKAKGIYISIDDFGTGYSSLSYLKRLPIDALKIDKSFIHDIYIDPTNAAIVTTIITLAKSLNLKVIAEGVETNEQLKFLKQHNCDEIQGYLIGKPVPSEQFETMLIRVKGNAMDIIGHSL